MVVPTWIPNKGLEQHVLTLLEAKLQVDCNKTLRDVKCEIHTDTLPNHIALTTELWMRIKIHSRETKKLLADAAIKHVVIDEVFYQLKYDSAEKRLFDGMLYRLLPLLMSQLLLTQKGVQPVELIYDSERFNTKIWRAP